MAVHYITPVFVEFIPENIEQGKLYISETYKTAIHKCCCGCGEEVVTPLSPADWQLKKGVNTVSLYPSIGNWNYKCKSHYFINNNRIIWAPKFSLEQIQAVQVRDRVDKLNYIADKNKAGPTAWSSFIDWLVKAWRFIRSLFS
ncbi:hypothetical protein Q2Y23_003461 [Vibrio fluvialis]|uniref:DUF6527 family protein n=1 Tax=Shewanella TaxID=22 RepID=UPI00201AFCFF|nr:DUF6527 family protein [Shewanella sp. 10B]ELM6622487.1 hypothetical protein [Vibrio fluvialis]